jgi:hypothetical protein
VTAVEVLTELELRLRRRSLLPVPPIGPEYTADIEEDVCDGWHRIRLYTEYAARYP